MRRDGTRAWISKHADVLTVLGGRVTRAGVRGLLKLLVAGTLGPQSLGVFRAVYSLHMLLASVTDVGVQYATITFISGALGRGDAQDARTVNGAALALRLAFGTLVLVGGNLIAPPVASAILGDPGLTFYVRLAFVAVAGRLLWRYLTSILTAHQEFRRLAYLLATAPIVMFATAVVLLVVGRLSLSSAIGIYLFIPAGTAVLWWICLDKRLRVSPAWDKGTLRRLVRFGGWVYASDMSSTARSHLNPLLLKSPSLSGSVAAGEMNAGLYGFGQDLAGEVSLVSQSIATVMLPKAAQKSDPRQLQRYVHRSYRKLLLLIVPLASLMLVAEPGLYALAGLHERFLDYLPSLVVFRILYAGGLMALLSIPMRTAVYAMNAPQLETYAEVGSSAVLIGGSIALIPLWGVVGAAAAILIQRVLFLAVFLGIGFARLARNSRSISV